MSSRETRSRNYCPATSLPTPLSVRVPPGPLPAPSEYDRPRRGVALDEIGWLRVAFAEVAVSDRVKRAGDVDPRAKSLAVASRLRGRATCTSESSTNQHPILDAGSDLERISMQMPGYHPDEDARIYWWMLGILWQMPALPSNSSYPYKGRPIQETVRNASDC